MVYSWVNAGAKFTHVFLQLAGNNNKIYYYYYSDLHLLGMSVLFCNLLQLFLLLIRIRIFFVFVFVFLGSMFCDFIYL